MHPKTSNLAARSKFRQRLILGAILKPLRLFCDHCDRYIPSDMEWICSYCQHENVKTKFYSFLNKCSNCKRSPRSYTCPHCESANFLDSAKSNDHPACARSTINAKNATLAPDSREQKREEREQIREGLHWEAEFLELNARILRLKASAEFHQQRTAREKLEKSFSDHDAHTMGAMQIVDEQQEKNAVRYKGNPEGLQRANESLQAWLETQL